MLIDTHAHLCDPCFDEDRPAVLARATREGVQAVVAVGETLADLEVNLALARDFPDMVRPAAGLFPTILDTTQARALAIQIRTHRERLFAIGEVGLDLWKVQDAGGREVQQEIFRLFIDLSRELDLPLNVHSRAAGGPTIELLLEADARRVQLHAFDGRAAKALPAVEAGFYFSIPPSVIRSVQKQKLVRQLPLECLLLETDSPVLGPDGQGRNEPANLVVAAKAIAEIKGLTVAEVTAAVAENTVRLYGDRILDGVTDT